MFSIYKFERDKKEKSIRDYRVKRYEHEETQRRDSLDKLVENYKKRVENFVVNLQMTENPIINQDNTNMVLKIRDEQPEKNLGAPCFKFTESKPVRDRSRDILKERNTQPIVKYKPVLHSFRARIPEKEIQPKMRFTADAVERITDNLNGMMRSMIDKADPDPKLSDSFLEEIRYLFIELFSTNSKSPVAVKKYIAKHIMPSLHRKTHFKAATSFVLKLPDTLRDKEEPYEAPKKDDRQLTEDKLLSGKGNMDESEDVSPNSQMKQKRMERQRSMERRASFVDDESPRKKKTDNKKKPDLIDPFKISKDVLVRCNFMKKRNPSVPILHRGDGRTTSVPDLSNRELYQVLYKKNIDSSARGSLKSIR